MKTRLQQWLSHIRANEMTYIPYAILFMAAAGMLGSLYFSNYGDPIANIKLLDPFPLGAGLLPCRLCWYARILLYPMVPLMIVAIWTKDRSFSKYILPLAALGLPLEIYHYIIQLLPKSLNIGSCDYFSPCNVTQVSYFGFITIPFLAFIAFAVIFALAWRYRRLSARV